MRSTKTTTATATVQGNPKPDDVAADGLTMVVAEGVAKPRRARGCYAPARHRRCGAIRDRQSDSERSRRTPSNTMGTTVALRWRDGAGCW